MKLLDKKPLLALAIIEIAYLAISRAYILNTQADPIPKELWWTAIRTASLILVFVFFRSEYLNQAPKKGRTSLYNPIILSSSLLFLSVPFLIGKWGLAYPTNVTYAATSLIIGLREEFVYRGVLQNILERRHGLWIALIFSNIAFALMHVGSLPFTPWNTFQFIAAGMILGLIYYRTRNIWFVAFLHTAYDAIWSFTPILKTPLPRALGFFLLTFVVLSLIVSSQLKNRGAKSQVPPS